MTTAFTRSNSSGFRGIPRACDQAFVQVMTECRTIAAGRSARVCVMLPVANAAPLFEVAVAAFDDVAVLVVDGVEVHKSTAA